jgi:hypothetical protein
VSGHSVGECTALKKAASATSKPAIPHYRLLLFGVINPRSLLHQQHLRPYIQSLGVAFTD